VGHARRRTLPYTGRRKRRAVAKVAAPVIAVNHEDMIFDQPAAKLPVATVVPREARAQLAADLRAWFVAKWAWFRPRTIPMVVALLGMLAVLGSATYLREYARQLPDRATSAPQGDARTNHVVIVVSQ